MVCSASDDRSIRLWQFSFGCHSNLHDTEIPLELWENCSSTCVHVLYGHSARVWDVRLLTSTLVSVGEVHHYSSGWSIYISCLWWSVLRLITFKCLVRRWSLKNSDVLYTLKYDSTAYTHFPCFNRKMSLVTGVYFHFVYVLSLKHFLWFQDSTCCVWNYNGDVLQKFKGHKVSSHWIPY